MRRDTKSIFGWGGAALLIAACFTAPCFAAGLLQSKNSLSARQHKEQGVVYLNQHNLPRALDEFHAALLLDPKDPAAHDNLGIALAESGQNDEAAKEFEEAVRLSVNFALAHFHLALAYDRLGRTPEAILEYETTLRLEPGLIDARYALSADCWKLGDGDGAIQLLRQIVKQNPPFAAEVHYNLGLELKQVGNMDEAARELKIAVALQPNSPKFYIGLCQILTEKLDLDGAIDSAKKAIELAPGNPEAHYDLAEALRLKGELGLAEAQYKRVLEINPEYALAHRQLGVVFRQKGSYEAAAAQLQDAAQEDPQDAGARYYLGSVLLKLNNVDGAIEELTGAIRLNPYDSAVHITLAGALNRVGRAQDAQEEIKKAQTLKDLEADAGRSRLLLGSAETHLKKNETEAALAELRQAVQLSPEYPEAQFQLARGLQQKGAPAPEVEKILRKVIDLKSDYAQAHLQLGLVLENTGHQAEAAAEFKRALEIAPSLVEAHRALGKSAFAAHDWPAAIAEFGAILVWDKDDRAARQNLAFAHVQQRRPGH
ncbi:MAG TPA: tetratricopeptide repeat protein [Terriglobia bacterium]|nr:tetratricopeptide repeat protein [Terriglobia bacterium]